MQDRDNLAAEIMENAAGLPIAGQSYLLTLAKGMSIARNAGAAQEQETQPAEKEGA